MRKLLILLPLMTWIASGCSGKKTIAFENKTSKITILNSKNGLWQYQVLENNKTYQFKGPQFEIDGKKVQLSFSEFKPEKHMLLRNNVTQMTYSASVNEIPGLTFKIDFRFSPDNPIIKFRYEIQSTQKHILSKGSLKDDLTYLSTSLQNFNIAKEIRFSEFNEMVHSFCLSERDVHKNDFDDSTKLMGPMFTASDGKNSFLLAYEHGSQIPDKFIEFSLDPLHMLKLEAVKGNYFNGFDLTKGYQTIWFEIGAISGTQHELANHYRHFMLKYMSENLESRKPYIFYNTWNFQERNKHWNKKPYLEDMTLSRMLKEIEVAHQMGIEVFVIDAGWFEKTGDWAPSLKRFPDSLKQVKAKLTSYGMKLGLWFNPTVAAVTSQMYKNHINCVRTMNGDKGKPWPIWETEESYGMCLVSPYRDAFADKLIQLTKTLGVTYFKWDAIGQYECNDPHHYHGDSTNTPQERLENYAFEIGRSMSYVVDKLSKACPEAIVDFDITEGGRAVGLSFLSSGKYFLINNGPYYFNYNIPFDMNKDNWNIFFYPGPARGWICRTPLPFDKWIPSVLFLTHYLPDDPYENQSITVGSLILGQNGIWGDLPSISNKGIAFFKQTLGYYKQVREDMTAISMIRSGAVGGSPEVYEKINPKNGKGAIVIFSSQTGKYSYISENKVRSSFWATKGINLTVDQDGKANVEADFKTTEAKIIFLEYINNACPTNVS